MTYHGRSRCELDNFVRIKLDNLHFFECEVRSTYMGPLAQFVRVFQTARCFLQFVYTAGTTEEYDLRRTQQCDMLLGGKK